MASVVGKPLIASALELLVASGLACERWNVLSDRNRLVVELQPCNRVAKIALADAASTVERELALAVHIAGRGGPVARPSRAPSIVRSASLVISLWEPLTVLGSAPPAPAPAYRVLRPFLDSFPEPLPDFRDAIRAALTALASALTPRGLSPDAARFVVSRFAKLCAHLEEFSWPERVLHGDPHAGNVLMTPRGACWLDFESACRGPIEWDLGALPSDHGIEHRAELLHLLRSLRSACVIAWCAVKAEPNRDELDAVACHLEQLRLSTPS